MASGVNFNNSSFHIPQGVSRTSAAVPKEQPVANPSDGFQPSEQPAATPTATTTPGVTFNCTPQQLGTAAFQQTLATLASSGIPVSVTLLNTGDSQPQASSGDSVSRQEFQNLKGSVESLAGGMGRLESQLGIIAQKINQPSTPAPTYHPPTYGGD